MGTTVTATIHVAADLLLVIDRAQAGSAIVQVRSEDPSKVTDVLRDGAVPAEIEPLRDEINALIQSNEDIVERARTQVGNLAHGLKTPLAVMTNEARGHGGPLGRKAWDADARR